MVKRGDDPRLVPAFFPRRPLFRNLNLARRTQCYLRMKWRLILATAGLLGVLGLGTGCRTPIPPGAEVGPERTIAHDMLVETSVPGVVIEANGEYMGKSPIHLKIFGNIKGTFHDFGSDYFIVRALPAGTNQYAQTRVFRTDKDMIPKAIYFDMTQPPPPPATVIYDDRPRTHFYFYGGWPLFYHRHHYWNAPLPPLPPLPLPHRR